MIALWVFDTKPCNHLKAFLPVVRPLIWGPSLLLFLFHTESLPTEVARWAVLTPVQLPCFCDWLSHMLCQQLTLECAAVQATGERDAVTSA